MVVQTHEHTRNYRAVCFKWIICRLSMLARSSQKPGREHKELQSQGCHRSPRTQGRGVTVLISWQREDRRKKVQKKKRRRDLKREGPTITFKGTPSVAKGDLLRGPAS